MAIRVLKYRRLLYAARATPGGFPIGRFRVVHPERDLAYTVAMPLDMVGNFTVGRERRRQYKADLALLQDIGNSIAGAGFRPSVRHQLHTECSTIVIRRLLGVADIELNVIG